MVRAIEVEVYEPDAVTLVDTLESDDQRVFLDDENGEGSYTFSIKIGHADESVAVEDRIVRFKINGLAVWQAVIDETAPRLADEEDRKSGQVIGVTGRDLLPAILEDAVVYPELGLGRVSPDIRGFNFTSSYYDDSAWPNAVELKQQNDPDPDKPWFGAPKDWKDPNGKWIGPTGGDIPGEVPPGRIYLRGSHTVGVGEGGEYVPHVSADDGFVFYRDAAKVAEEQQAGLWGITRPLSPLLLDEGLHRFAAEAINFDRPVAATNVFGFICSIFKVLGGGASLGPAVTGTSAGTKMLAYPDKPPGLTPGHILDILLTEAQARGWQPDLTWDFTASLDSDGNAWPDEIDVSFPVNTSLLEVVRHLAEEHSCYVRMAATGLTMHAYVTKGQDLSATVAAEYGVNIARHAAKKQRAAKNVTLSRTAEGRWVESSDATSVAVYGRREIGFSLGSAPSDEAADRQTSAFLADNAYPVHAITDLQIEAVNFVPYVDFVVGDIISAPITSTISGSFRVASIRVSEDEACQPIYTPELVFTGSLWASPLVLWDDPVATWGVG